MRIISLNLNGIRSAWRKGLAEWIGQHVPDVIAFQELKAQDSDLLPGMRSPSGYHAAYHCAGKKGYSGVGLWSREAPLVVRQGFGDPEFDAEGRYLRADFAAYSVISVYLPSGSSSPERQAAKFRFMARFLPHLAALRAEGREIVICGDWNIAHREIDLRNWKGNQKNSGFLPEERAWFSRLIDELGWVDVYRSLYPDQGEAAYTWWSNRGAAWEKNVGWRIDYQMATPAIAARATEGWVEKSRRFSDHAPLIINYDLGPVDGNFPLDTAGSGPRMRNPPP
jgi:exodeoxyribonuclease-3